MSELDSIRLELLSPAEQSQLRESYRRALASAPWLTQREAAWYYGYSYQTIRHYVAEGVLKARRSGRFVKLTHAEMRRHLRTKKPTGSPRRALKNLQTTLP